MLLSLRFELIDDYSLPFQLENWKWDDQCWLAPKFVLLNKDARQLGQKAEDKADTLTRFDYVLIVVAEELRALVEDGLGIDPCAWEPRPLVINGRAANIADAHLFQIYLAHDLFEVDVGTVDEQLRSKGNHVGCLLLLLCALAEVFCFLLLLCCVAAEMALVFKRYWLFDRGSRRWRLFADGRAPSIQLLAELEYPL